MKKLTDRDRVLTYFHQAPQADIATLLETGRHIIAARFPNWTPAAEKKRGRPARPKTEGAREASNAQAS